MVKPQKYFLIFSAEQPQKKKIGKSEAPKRDLLKINLVSVTCAMFLLLVVR